VIGQGHHVALHGLELRAHVLRDAGHLVERLGAADIHPVPELLRAHLALRRRNADLAQPVGDLGARQADQ
jgi:hypothetical protein